MSEGRMTSTSMEPEGHTMTSERIEPCPNPPVRHGARRSPEDEALAFLRSNRDTHTRWAEYFEKNPEIEKEYAETGVWEGAADQRRLEREYNAAIATFERLTRISRPAPSEEMVEAGRVAYSHFRQTIERDVLFCDLTSEEQEELATRIYDAMNRAAINVISGERP